MDPAAHDPSHERVRAELARLGTDAASAPDVPAEVTARIDAALRSARPAHAIDRPRLRRGQRAGLAVGMAAVLAGGVIGVTTLTRDPQQSHPIGPTAKQMTAAAPTIPLTDGDVLALLSRPPDYGALGDPLRRASCLDGLGYAGRQVWGAQPVDVGGRPAVLLVLPGDTAGEVVAVAVVPDCHTAHTGRLAETRITRP